MKLLNIIWALIRAFAPIVLVLALLISMVLGVGYLLNETVKEIETVGLKTIIENIWYGADE